jgi:sec-independent protein translocase protein TatC
MPLRQHLSELRRRLFKAALGIVAGAVAGWFIYDWLFMQLSHPLLEVADERNLPVNINFSQLASSFNLHVKLSVYLGIAVASPIWLYQLWAFITPGLTRRERRFSLLFSGIATLLFAGGLSVAWLVLPNAVKFFAEFAPDDTSILLNADDYFTFVTRIMLAFGIAFVLPLVLVGLNLVGILSALTLAKGWRVAVFVCFLFAAIASPTPDAGSMLALAFPMVALYLSAVGVAWLVDRRRARRAPGDLEDRLPT